MFQPRRILCPTDLSEISDFAMQIALDLARQNQASLIVLYVAETLGPEKLTFAEASTQLQPETHIEQLRRELHRKVPMQRGLDIQYLLMEGDDPATVVDQVARERDCDLIVVGTHGRTGLEHLLMGSIAERVIRLSPCPVLVAKDPKLDSHR
jgi:universal stress protein A